MNRNQFVSRAVFLSTCVACVNTQATLAAGLPHYYVTNLGTLGGYDSSASGINERGQVVGAAKPPGSGYPHAFLWTPTTPNGISGSMVDLGTFGWDSSGAIASFAEPPSANVPEPSALALTAIGLLGMIVAHARECVAAHCRRTYASAGKLGRGVSSTIWEWRQTTPRKYPGNPRGRECCIHRQVKQTKFDFCTFRRRDFRKRRQIKRSLDY